MAVKTVVREGETVDDALRRFKRGVNKSGILYEIAPSNRGFCFALKEFGDFL